MESFASSLRLITDSGMFILIWLVQIIIYPTFRDIREERFVAWHRHYVNAIGFFVIPMMLLQLGSTGFECYLTRSLPDLLALMMLAGAWMVTFTLSAPCHKKLQKVGQDEHLITYLIRTNWLRTIFWSLSWLIGIIWTGN